STKLINAADGPNLKNVLIVNMVVPSDELRIRKNPSYGMAQRCFRWKSRISLAFLTLREII
ncbi:MAG TPA: hypothetical protein VIF86_09025, partial [Methylobacter sp.]